MVRAEKYRTSVKGRKEVELRNGVVLVFSDAHYWPGAASTAHRALLKFSRKLKPTLIVANGDVLDACAISRHPPIGWNKLPSVKEELDVCKERLGEVVKAAPHARRFHLLGNHDARFETRLAQVAPEFKDVHGISLSDHLTGWEPGWALHINDNTVIKHRYKGGVHAPYGNTVSAGRSMITGHLHSQKVTPFTDYNGTRYGVDTGCLADPYHDAFQDYTEDNSKDWRSGFCVLTFHNGTILPPELVTVMDETHVYFRGALHEV
jgi:predicted phosphodiesterase